MSEAEAVAVPAPGVAGAGGAIPTVGDAWKDLLSSHPTLAHQSAHAIRANLGKPEWEELVASMVEMDNTGPLIDEQDADEVETRSEVDGGARTLHRGDVRFDQRPEVPIVGDCVESNRRL